MESRFWRCMGLLAVAGLAACDVQADAPTGVTVSPGDAGTVGVTAVAAPLQEVLTALAQADGCEAEFAAPISEHESPQAFRALLPLPLVLVAMFVVRAQFAGSVVASAVLALALVIGAVLLICPTRYRCEAGEVTRIRFGRCARVDLTRPFTARRRSALLAGCALVLRQGPCECASP